MGGVDGSRDAPGDRRGVRREEGKGQGEQGLAQEEDRGRKKEEVSHLSATPCREVGPIFPTMIHPDGARWGLPGVSVLPCALLPHPSTCHPVLGLTPPVGLGLDDLTDAPGAHAVLGRQLHLVPRAALEAVQPEGPLTRADEHILPLLTVVHRVL